MKKIDWLVIFSFLIISIFTLKDLFKPGFYTSHDGPHQVVRLYYFDQVIRDGQIPPRWVQGLLNGFGYPLFNFSYHLPWLIAEPIHLVGFSIFDSIKLTFLAGFVLSGITIYFFLKDQFGRLPAISGTIIYLFAPYRFSNIFVRAAIGDATSFIFIPLIFLSLNKFRVSERTNWKWIPIGALSLTAALLSHAMVFFFIFVAYSLYICYWGILLKKKMPFIISSLLAALLSFGLSGYYLLPSLIEKNYTRFTQTMKSVYFGNTFLDIRKLLYSPWGYGTVDAKEGAMSLQLGIAQWTVVILAAITIIYLLCTKHKIKKAAKLKEIIFYYLLFLVSITAMLPVSYSLWKLINGIILIDFPWRILPIPVFCVSVLAAFFISRVKYKVIFTLAIIILAVYANRNHTRINQTLDWKVPFYLLLEKTTNSYDEYTPKWVSNDVVNKLPKAKIEPFDAGSKVELIKSTSNYLEFILKNDKDDTVLVNTIYYPGWNVYIDGKLSNINYQNNGLIEFPVKSGNHLIKLRFEETPVRFISDLLTLTSGIFVIYLFIKYRKAN